MPEGGTALMLRLPAALVVLLYSSPLFAQNLEHNRRSPVVQHPESTDILDTVVVEDALHDPDSPGMASVFETGLTALKQETIQQSSTVASASAASLIVYTTSLTFDFHHGQSIPSQGIAVYSSGSPLTITASNTTFSGGSWISLTGRTTTPTLIQVSVNAANLSRGTYRGYIAIKSANVAKESYIGVTLKVDGGKGSSVTRILAPLFLGFNSSPTDPNNGLNKLLGEMNAEPDLAGLVGMVFSYTQGSDALAFLNARLTPQDKLVIIGHSYGGDEARLFTEKITNYHFSDSSKAPVRVHALAVIDPIDSSLTPTFTIQSWLREPRPKQTDFVIDLVQRTDTVLQGYLITGENQAFTYANVSHTEIDDDIRVHQRILDVLTNQVLK